ncbi:MAG: precorrin-6y C5,15-methyltransferase (decarboxylating) subunit CbiE [Gammaproteobacteria bacterium]|nr:precorrin-6y C5,15-methyltransferase (decarboxylating) subunit CbiE [Gammaproteobacteria bacterium]MCF6260362.1 precorrin-6y C5,15-methyltransferase (decarboxylating) subunit CbiE [Gammaproteobacteria bacterium]
MVASNTPIYIIGVLDNGTEGMTPVALAHIAAADVVIGAHRTLALFADSFAAGAIQHDIAQGLSKVPVWITEAQADDLKVVVLATGDPLCHGIGRYLMNKLGNEQCEVIPNVSTLQLAFARLGLAWQEAVIASAHSKDAGEWSNEAGPEHGLYPLLQTVQNHSLIALFTSPENTPDRIARMLLDVGLGELFTMSVAEALLTDDENIIRELSLSDAAAAYFTSPNVVVLQRITQNSLPVFGLDDACYAQRKPDKGLITKREVRAVSLARLQLHADSIVWDIGAGSGSVGLEAARLCRSGYVYAIEKNPADFAIVQQNRENMAITNYRVQHGKAPERLDTWPNPDAVFLGGSGGELAELIRLCLLRLKAGGWLVMNFVTLENLAQATQTLKEENAQWDVTQLQASRSQPILHMHRMAAENPVWIVCAQAAEKPTEMKE